MQEHNISSIQSFIHYVLSCIPGGIFMDPEPFCEEAPSAPSFPSRDISVASGDGRHAFLFFIGELECGAFILMDEFPPWEGSSVAPKLSGILLPRERQRHQRKCTDACSKQQSQLLDPLLSLVLDTFFYTIGYSRQILCCHGALSSLLWFYPTRQWFLQTQSLHHHSYSPHLQPMSYMQPYFEERAAQLGPASLRRSTWVCLSVLPLPSKTSVSISTIVREKGTSRDVLVST